MKNLKTISFSIRIQSGRENVWKVLWNPNTYEKWTRVFMEGSHIKGEIKQGNTIQFLGKDGNGMYSVIEKMIENEQIAFLHQGEVKNAVLADAQWKDSREIYYLKKESETVTELQVVMNTAEDMEAYFSETFPEALNRIKEVSEQ